MSEPKILEFERQNKRETGIEAKTNEFVDGKQVYVKRFQIESLPNNGSYPFDSGLDFREINIIRLEGVARYKSTGAVIPMNFSNPIATNEQIGLRCTQTGTITIYTGVNRSDYEGFVDMYYTKK